MSYIEKVARIVVKVGTSTLTHPNGKINLRRIEELARVLSDLKNAGKEIVLVSSGAIGAGMGKLGLKKRPSRMEEKQAAAAVGQCELMKLYDTFFTQYGQTVAQVLLTRDVIETPVLKANAENTFRTLLEFGTIPVVNENDTISVEEISPADHTMSTFGENDTLSAIVACLVSADLLILLSDIDGLYTKDPHRHPDARLIETVEKIDQTIENLAGGAGSGLGTGGMISKINAAKIAAQGGICMAILNGENPRILYELFDGKHPGTLFLAGASQGEDRL